MEFLILAYDGTEEGVLQRRHAVREKHLEGIQKGICEGSYLYGTVLLNEDGEMAGSMLVVAYPSREKLEEWLKEEVYVTENVWERIEILPCRVPEFLKEKH